MRLNPCCTLALTFLSCLSVVDSAAAATRFPYEAVVQSREAVAHSGPGRSYYSTSKLGRGARVTVHRHDPGGWYMVAPPKGSFSWIRAEHVRREGGSRGVISQNDVVVRVGSANSDTRDVEQVRLSRGAIVQIINEAGVAAPGGVVRMYRILPPRGEFRWIEGRNLTAAEPGQRQAAVADPSSASSEVKAGSGYNDPRHGPTIGPPKNAIGDRPLVRTQNGAAVRRSGAEQDRIETDRRRLQELDDQFRAIIKQDVSKWDFTQLERDYAELKQAAANPAFARQVELRFPAIARYRGLRGEYDKVVALTDATERRDAELAARQQRITHRLTGRPPAQTNVSAPARQQPQPTAAPTRRQPQPTRKQFDGAGIIASVKGSQAGFPKHALIHPNGKLLAYLESANPQVNLDQYVGRSMGIVGRRTHRPQLRSDYIRVQSLQPVRLRP